MKFFNNVKLRYQLNLLKESLRNNNDTETLNILFNIKNIDQSQYKNILKNNITAFIDNDNFSNLFKRNIIWTNSFESKETKIFNDILENLISKSPNFKTLKSSFYDEAFLNLDKEEIQQYSKISDSFYLSHYYFQKLILDKEEDQLKILSNQSAFYEYSGKIYFTHKNLTRCFFFIFKHPYEVFSNLKSSGMSSREALDILCNLDSRPNERFFIKNGNRINYEESRRSWAINFNSWMNPNTLSTLRGMPINLNKILENTEDKIFEIAAHLKESGLDIEINNSHIRQLKNSFDFFKQEKNKNPNISNNEKKIIDRECGDIINEHFDEI